MNKFFFIFILLLLLINKLFAISNLNNISYINTKNVTYNEEEQKIILGQDTLVNINNTTIKVNKGIIDYKNDKIEIFGKFYIYQNNLIFTGTDLIGKVNFKNFKANTISFSYDEELKIDSDKIIKINNILYFYNNFLTPCEIDGYFNCPTWSLKISKTKYDVSKDKFTHYNSFLQIADKKILYVPYFMHYGNKAPRKAGFLTPTLELNLGNGGASIKTPYYIPLNDSNDLTITPSFSITDPIKEFSEELKINTKINSKQSGGESNVEIFTNIQKDNNKFYNSLFFEQKKIISKKNNYELKTLLTNNISHTRSINTEQIPFQESYLKVNSYSLFRQNDLLISSAETVTAFDDTSAGLVPVQIPSIHYQNIFDKKNGSYIDNILNFTYLKRRKTDSDHPSENFMLNIKNKLTKKNKVLGKKIINKFILNNSYNNNSYSDKNYFSNSIGISSEFNNQYYKNLLKVKIKLIANQILIKDKNIANEDSNSTTFNYYNLFHENKNFGFNEFDNSRTISYGVEYNNYIKKYNYGMSFGQSYDFLLDKSYIASINQTSNFSDYAFNAYIDFKYINFNADIRLDRSNFSKKEINYSLDSITMPEFQLKYNETSQDAFLNNSNDSKSLNLIFKKIINNNINFSYSTILDLKNNYNPFKSNLTFNIFDECSNLAIEYENTQFSDSASTRPKESISFTYTLNYIGFFNYENRSNIFY